MSGDYPAIMWCRRCGKFDYYFRMWAVKDSEGKHIDTICLDCRGKTEPKRKPKAPVK